MEEDAADLRGGMVGLGSFVQVIKPFGVFFPFPLHQVEKEALDLLGNGSGSTLADAAVVQFPNGGNFCGRSGEKDLVGNVELVAGDQSLFHGNPLLGEELENRMTCDAFQNVGE